jgi:hypothetical protein
VWRKRSHFLTNGEPRPAIAVSLLTA